MARPSTVTVTVSFCCSVCWLISPEGTAALLDVDEELVPEHAHGGGDRRGDGGAEHADRGLLGRPGQTRGDVVAHVEEKVEVLLPARPVLDPAHDLLQPSAALSTGGALPARLVVEKLGDAPGGTHHARGLVHHHHRARPEHGARLADGVLVEGHVELVGPEPGGRGTAGDEGLQGAVARNAAPEPGMVDEVAERVLDHLDLVVAWPVHVAREGEHAGAGRAALAEGGIGAAPVEDDPGQVRKGLHVVDHGGGAVEADGGGEIWGLDAGEAALALQALEEGRLLAADVGAGTGVNDQVDPPPGSEDVVADGAVLVGLVDGRRHALEAQGELTPDVDEGLGRPGGVGADQRGFDDLVGIVQQELVVLERGRLALVPVDHQVDGLCLAQHRPFPARLETGSAPTQQVRRRDLLGYGRGIHGEGLAQAQVAPVLEGGRQRPRVAGAEPAGEDRRRVGRRHQPWPSCLGSSLTGLWSWLSVTGGPPGGLTTRVAPSIGGATAGGHAGGGPAPRRARPDPTPKVPWSVTC